MPGRTGRRRTRPPPRVLSVRAQATAAARISGNRSLFSDHDARLPAVPDNYFDETIAAMYDSSSGGVFDPAVLGPTVDFLAELAGDGVALEFGIGTGRVALPLSQRGVRVRGIDLSPA